MSMSYPTEWELKMLARPCDFCGAQPDQWCRTETTLAQSLHSARHYRTRREVYA